MMNQNNFEKLIIKQKNFLLLPQKCIFWVDKNILIISDFHIGKIQHFRKDGIPLPYNAALRNIEKLRSLIKIYNPCEIIFLGDLFHSYFNLEFNLLKNLLTHYKNIKFNLITGNHDIYSLADISNFNIEIITKFLVIDEFIFEHERNKNINLSEKFSFSGHIHPVLKIKLSLKEHIKIPVFISAKNYCILPAFGEFTGSQAIKDSQTEKYFGIIDNKVIRLL